MDIVVDIVDNHFNPRLREGGDLTFYSSYMGMIISIHASAKEATEIRARGPHSKKDFNPRLREGGDVLNLASAGAMSLISIHASAKEATRYRLLYGGNTNRFQSTPPRRRRRSFPTLTV